MARSVAAATVILLDFEWPHFSAVPLEPPPTDPAEKVANESHTDMRGQRFVLHWRSAVFFYGHVAKTLVGLAELVASYMRLHLCCSRT
jgi:hypothetical protein